MPDGHKQAAALTTVTRHSAQIFSASVSNFLFVARFFPEQQMLKMIIMVATECTRWWQCLRWSIAIIIRLILLINRCSSAAYYVAIIICRTLPVFVFFFLFLFIWWWLVHSTLSSSVVAPSFLSTSMMVVWLPRRLTDSLADTAAPAHQTPTE